MRPARIVDVTIICSLCNARVGPVTGEERQAAAECERQARAAGFVHLPGAPARRRSEGWLCEACADDVCRACG